MRRLLLLLGFLPALAAAENLYPAVLDWRPPDFDYRFAKGTQVSEALNLPLSVSGGVLPEDSGTVSHVVFGPTTDSNYALQSSTISTGTALNLPWGGGATGTIATVAGAPDGKNWAQITPAFGFSNISQTVTIPATTSTTVRWVAAKAAGTGAMSARTACAGSTLVSCTATRSGAGVVGNLGPLYASECTLKVTDLSTTPETFTLITACATPVTSALIYLIPGDFDAVGTATKFSMAQVEADGAPGQYLPTTTAEIVNPDGLVETTPPSTVVANYLLQSESMSTGSAATSPWALGTSTVTTVAGAPSGGTWAEVTNSSNIGAIFQTATMPSATAWAASVWASKASGTGAVTLALRTGGSAVGVACTRSGAGSCTLRCGAASSVANTQDCEALVTDLGTTPERITVTATGTATTAPLMILYPGQGGTSTGTTRFSQAQIEPGLTVGTYTKTTTATVYGPVYSGTTPLAWTMNGTVPQVAASVSPFVPGKPGAGPYSAANSYQGPTTLGEWQGDWSVTVVWKRSATATADQLLAKNAGTGTNGWQIYAGIGGAICLYVHDGVFKSACTAALGAGGPHVATVGRSGTTIYAKANAAATASTAGVGSMTSGAASPIRIGRADAAGDAADESVIYEILASTTPYSDALHAARFNAVFGLLPGPVSVTRADPVTYTANGFVWSAPPATMGIGASGAEVWKGSTNYVLQSGTISTGTAATAPWSLTSAAVATVAGDPAGGNWAEITNTVSGGYISQSVATASSASFSAAATFRSVTGSSTGTIIVQCGAANVSTCTASAESGAAPTVLLGTPLVNYCTVKKSDFSTTPNRMAVNYTCASAIINPAIYLSSDYQGVGGVTIRASLASLETSAYPTPYIATTGTATARAATVSTVPLPALGNRWCASVTATPGPWTWGTQPGSYLWSNYAGALANSMWMNVGGGFWNLSINDSAGVIRTASCAHGLGASTAAQRITACNNNGAIAVYRNGAFLCAGSVGAGTALQTATVTPLNLGNHALSGYIDGSISNLKICKGATKASECR